MGGRTWEQDQELLRDAVQQRLPLDIPEDEWPKDTDNVDPESLPYYETPRSDNQKLMNCQREFRMGDKTALARMYKIMDLVARKYINKLISMAEPGNPIRRLSTEDRHIKASDAASYIVEQLITREDFMIKDSFTGYLWLRVLHECFYYRKVDKVVHFVDIARFYKSCDEDDYEAIARMLGETEEEEDE